MAPSTIEDRTAVSAASTTTPSNGAKKRKASITPGHAYGHYYKDMNTSMIKSKFLSNPEDLGVVAVGFSGGQVYLHFPLSACLLDLCSIPTAYAPRTSSVLQPS